MPCLFLHPSLDLSFFRLIYPPPPRLYKHTHTQHTHTHNTRTIPTSGVDENFIRVSWQAMLEAVHTIHEERIVHGDLKPANFLFVQGKLKLIDFGIAKTISDDTTNIHRDTQVGTLNYMAPEAITDTVGVCLVLGRGEWRAR